MIAANIDWDCTDEEREDLPRRVPLPGPEDYWLDDPDRVTEYLSDEYGFCLNSGPLLFTQEDVEEAYTKLIEEPLFEYGLSEEDITYEDAVDVLCNVADGMDEGNCIGAQLQAIAISEPDR